MTLDLQDTIVAQSSAALAGRRAIVRLSGPRTKAILASLMIRGEHHSLLDATRARSQYVAVALDWSQRSIDAQLYFWPNANSYTGETCAEIHLLGSQPVVESLIRKICQLGARPADRGEFTLRSFLAGKIDLTQAEAVLAVIEANDDAELQSALAQLGGNLSTPVRAMRQRLIDLVANLEAGLDFVEEDIEFITTESLLAEMRAVLVQLGDLLDQLQLRDARPRNPRVALVGLPNAGKSSLFNRLLGRARTIVSPLAGTTRDVVSERLTLPGIELDLIDTAGIEELVGDTPRAMAQNQLQSELRRADGAVLCGDLAGELDDGWWQATIQQLKSQGLAVLTVGTKDDLPRHRLNTIAYDITISCTREEDIQRFQQRLLEWIRQREGQFQSEALQQTAIRCRRSLELAQESLKRGVALAELGDGEELVAAELRMALDDLGAIIGEVHSDDILGEIFRRFCIGK